MHALPSRLVTILILGTTWLWTARSARAETPDVFDGADPVLLHQTQCSGWAAAFWADVDGNQTKDTLVVLTMVAGNGGLSDLGTGFGYGYSFSDVICNAATATAPGQIAINFVDTLAPGFVWNNPATWQYKAVPAARIDSSWEGGSICPRSNTSNPYFRVQAYRERGQVQEITGTQTAVPGTTFTRNAFADPAGVGEIYIHTDYCENDLNALVLGVGAPVILSGPTVVQQFPGKTLRLSVNAAGTPPLTYQWFKDGQPVHDLTFHYTEKVAIARCLWKNVIRTGSISGATTQQLTLVGAQPGHSGSYTVAVTNPGGTTTSSAVPITIAPQQIKPCVLPEFPRITPQRPQPPRPRPL